jgi:hypothetical protein
MEDARLAVETGVDGVDVVIGTSSILREFSHGKDMASITKSAIEVINFVKRCVYLAIHTLGSRLILVARVSKSASRPRTPSGPTLSTCSAFTKQSIKPVSIELASPILSDVLLRVPFTTWCGPCEA